MSELKRIEREQQIELLQSTVADLDQTMTLDFMEQSYVYGAKDAAKMRDWTAVWCHLSNLEDHIKKKLDQVHKLTVQVKRETRRR